MMLLQGVPPLDPGIYRLVSKGLSHQRHFAAQKKSDAVWRRPRKTGGRSGRIPALPYPPVTPVKQLQFILFQTTGQALQIILSLTWGAH